MNHSFFILKDENSIKQLRRKRFGGVIAKRASRASDTGFNLTNFVTSSVTEACIINFYNYC
jgi:hypothetical protein